MKILPVCRRFYGVCGGSTGDLLINTLLSTGDCEPKVVLQVVQLLGRSSSFTSSSCHIS